MLSLAGASTAAQTFATLPRISGVGSQTRQSRQHSHTSGPEPGWAAPTDSLLLPERPLLRAHHVEMSPGGRLRFLFPLWSSPSSSHAKRGSNWLLTPARCPPQAPAPAFDLPRWGEVGSGPRRSERLVNRQLRRARTGCSAGGGRPAARLEGISGGAAAGIPSADRTCAAGPPGALRKQPPSPAESPAGFPGRGPEGAGWHRGTSQKNGSSGRGRRRRDQHLWGPCPHLPDFTDACSRRLGTRAPQSTGLSALPDFEPWALPH